MNGISSPLKNISELLQVVHSVAENSTRLSEEIIGTSFPIHSLTVFSHSEKEFKFLKELLNTMGAPYNENNGPRVVLHEPIIVGDNAVITHLRIRKPDPDRPQVGCNDFDVEDYEAFKTEYLSRFPENLFLIERPDYEMIEFRHPDYDVLAYLVSG